MRSFFLDAGLEEFCTRANPPASLRAKASPFIRSMEYLFILASRGGDWVHVHDPIPEDYLDTLKEWTQWDLGDFYFWNHPSPHTEKVLWEHLDKKQCKDTLCNVNSKVLSTDISRQLGYEDSFVVHNLGELENLLLSIDTDSLGLAKETRWVLKEVYGVGGRGKRIFNKEEFFKKGSIVAWSEKRFSKGPLILEPFYQRLAEFGSQFWVNLDGSYELFYTNEILATKNGAYRGARFHKPSLEFQWKEENTKALEKVSKACAKLGYTGPCGIDSMEVSLVSGETLFRSCSEINARWGMGYLGGFAVDRLSSENLVCEWRQIPPSSLGFDVSTYPKKFLEWRESLGDLAFNGKEGILILSPSTQKDPLKKERSFSYLSFAGKRSALRDITQAFNVSFGVERITEV